jgi:hypothetical protein
MSYSKSKLKSNGDKAYPCFGPFQIRSASDRCLPVRTLLYVLFEYILRAYVVLYTFLQTETQAVLKCTYSWHTVPLYSHIFSSISRMLNILSVVDYVEIHTDDVQ